MIAKRKGVVARRGLKEAWSKDASRWTKTGYEAYGAGRAGTLQRSAYPSRALVVNPAVKWFWGHEHRLALYEKFRVKEGVEAYGRCIGHGGMPVERGAAPDILDCRWLAWDNRRYPSDEKLDFGYNGHANLSLNGPALRIAYYDLNQSLLLTEDWHIDTESGALEGPSLKKVLDDSSLHCREA